MRYLALHDPDLSEHQLEELSHDPDAWIRRTTLADSRLPATRIAQLTDDPDPASRAGPVR